VLNMGAGATHLCVPSHDILSIYAYDISMI
jgi:hypothetical protein